MIPKIPLLGVSLKKKKKLKSNYQRPISIPMFIAALLVVAKMWKLQICPSIDE